MPYVENATQRDSTSEHRMTIKFKAIDQYRRNMIHELNFKIVGTAPLLMHNGQLASPQNSWARAMKKVSSKRAKTDADYDEMARLEFLGGLYLAGGEPCIPGNNIRGTLIGKGSAARKMKMGRQGAAGLFITENFPLLYEGPRDPHEMWESGDFILQQIVCVGQARVLRTRPIFREWAAQIRVEFNDTILDANNIVQWFDVAGEEVGLGDYRPTYGRFVSTQLDGA